MSNNTNDTPLPTRALVSVAGAVRKDTQAAIATADGSVGALQMDAAGNLRTVGGVDSNAITAGGVVLTPKFAAIAAATSGNNTLVAAVTGKKIRVLSLMLVAGAAGNIYFTTAAGGTVIFGGSTNTINLPANGGFVLPFSSVGWFETVAAQLLNMNASSTGPFSGGLVYVEV